MCTQFGVIKSKLLAVKCDVTKSKDVTNLVKRAINQFGRIDILVNCAGCMYYCMVANGYTQVCNNFFNIL